MFGHFIICLLWSMAWAVSADRQKHFLEYNEPTIFESKEFFESGPIAFSARVRRQLQSGPSSFYIYDTDTEEESGPWGSWESGRFRRPSYRTVLTLYFGLFLNSSLVTT